MYTNLLKIEVQLTQVKATIARDTVKNKTPKDRILELTLIAVLSGESMNALKQVSDQEITQSDFDVIKVQRDKFDKLLNETKMMFNVDDIKDIYRHVFF